MSEQTIVEGSSCPTDHLTPDQLSNIKAIFQVAGEIRVIESAPGYAVSDDGRVFSTLPCKWQKNELRELKQSTTQHGYRMIHLHIGKKPKLVYVHALTGKAFLSPAPLGQERIRHLDGNPSNNAIANLSWGTQKQNMQDMIRHGRSLKGCKSPNAKLNDNIVRAIRILSAEGYRSAAMAHFLGVSLRTIERVINGEQWNHIDDVNS